MTGRPARLAPGLWVLVLAVIGLPRAATASKAGLDHSWDAAIRLALEHRLQWGTDFVFTYGPLGMLHDPRYVTAGTWAAALPGRLAVHVAFYTAFALLLRQVGARPWEWLVVGLLLVTPEVLLLEADMEAEMAAALLLACAALTAEARPRAAYAAGAGALLAVATLVKGSAFDAAAALLGVFLVALLLTRRVRTGLPAVALAFVVTWVALWAACGQGAGNVIPYVRTSLELVRGYTSAMTFPPDPALPFVPAQIGLAAGAIGVTALLALAGLALREWRLFAVAAMVAPLLFLFFKEEFVRYGDRQVNFFWLAAMLEGAAAVAVWRVLEPRLNPLAALPAVTAAAMLVGALGAPLGGVTYAAEWPFASVPLRVYTYGLGAQLLFDARAQTALENQSKSRIRAAYGVEPRLLEEIGSATVDVMPADTIVTYAYGLNWEPRPVIQSYADYTPALDRQTAAHLEGAGAPRFLLVSSFALDGAYMPFVEPATFRAVINHYEVVDQGHQFLLLRRREVPRAPVARNLGAETVPLGGWVTVPKAPAGARLYAAVTIRYAKRGVLLDLVYDASPLTVWLRHGAAVTSYRLGMNNTVEGLELESYLEPGDPSSLRDLLAGRSRESIQAFRIATTEPKDYQPWITVSFFSEG